MAAADVASRTPERSGKRKPFTNWVKRLANFKSTDAQGGGKKGGAAHTSPKHKKSQTQDGNAKNNPYPGSGPLRQRSTSPASSANGQLSFYTPTTRTTANGNGSFTSVTDSTLHDREGPSNGNRSGAPTVATNPETVHSDAGQSKAATATTGGVFSSTDGAGMGSTFSSPNQSEHSLTTTLTTIQSQAPGNALQSPHSSQHHHSQQHSQHSPHHNGQQVMFSHQYPTSPAPSGAPASAIPRHVAESGGPPNTYSAATANNLLTDNASILTLASSSKRRRRSMDTDASVRAIPPSSVWGGSRESLPLSVLSGHTAEVPATGGIYSASHSRPSIGGFASAERASVYSSQGVPAMTPTITASDRTSFYATSTHRKEGGAADAKSLRSITNMDARSMNAPNADAKSVRSLGVGGYHGRSDSLAGASPLASPGLMRQASISGQVSRRSGEWARDAEKEEEEEEEEEDESGQGRSEESKAEQTPAEVREAIEANKF